MATKGNIIALLLFNYRTQKKFFRANSFLHKLNLSCHFLDVDFGRIEQVKHKVPNVKFS